MCPTAPCCGTGPPAGVRPRETEVVAAVEAEGPGTVVGDDDAEAGEEKALAKRRTGTEDPLVCRTTGLVTRKHFSL